MWCTKSVYKRCILISTHHYRSVSEFFSFTLLMEQKQIKCLPQSTSRQVVSVFHHRLFFSVLSTLCCLASDTYGTLKSALSIRGNWTEINLIGIKSAQTPESLKSIWICKKKSKVVVVKSKQGLREYLCYFTSELKYDNKVINISTSPWQAHSYSVCKPAWA